MKKTLSIILSLLMVLGCMTCLFTMPATAEEASTTTSAAVAETLPASILSGTTVKEATVTAESNNNYNGNTAYPMGTSAYVTVQGWNAVKDEDGNIISGYDKSYFKPGIQFQLDVTVTTDAELNEGVKFYPVFRSNADTNQPMTNVVGIRYEEATPGAVETAYNYVANAKGTTTENYRTDENGDYVLDDDGNKIVESKTYTPSMVADNAATLTAGKTYKYTYIIKTSEKWINGIEFKVDGITSGSVTFSEPNMFDLTGTEFDNFTYNGDKIVQYMVKENDNVFMRAYGYRAVGDTAVAGKKRTWQAKLGGGYYNLYFEGGNTYNMDFDFRIPTGAVSLADVGYAVQFNFYETGVLDYADDFAALRASLNIADDADTYTGYTVSSTGTTTQREYSAPSNGYSYTYNYANGSTRMRRVGYSNMTTFSFTDPDGVEVYTDSGATSEIGRDARKDADFNAANGKWLDGAYSLNAVGAQTMEDAATKGKSVYARYSKSTGAWVFNSNYKNLYLPAEEDVYVALGMEYFYSGCVYDFDDFKISVSADDLVEYKNTDGDVIDLPASETPANVIKTMDSASVVYTISNHDNYDGFAFEGWYVNGELVGTDATITVASTDTVKPVIVYKNVLTYGGGFENYDSGTNLEAAYTEVSAGCTKYPNYNGGTTFRYYNSVPPTGDKWTGWDRNMNSSKLSDSDNGVTNAQIIADIKAAGGDITTSGVTGFTYFQKFPTVTAAKEETYHTDAGSYSSKAAKVYVEPYRGDRMLGLQASTRTGYRELNNLEAGKYYTVSFYTYSVSEYNFLSAANVTTSPKYVSAEGSSNDQTTVLAQYLAPYTVVASEKYLDKTGVETTKTNVKHADSKIVQQWIKVSMTFCATDDVAYLGLYNQTSGDTSARSFIDELAVVEYDCAGNHLYDDEFDTVCDFCGETRELKADWDFEDSNVDRILTNGGTAEIVDAVDQPEKIGSKYLQYTTTGWNGIAFNFPYNSKDTYIISYDFKVFTYGTGTTANGIDHNLNKYDDGKYGADGTWGGTTTTEKSAAAALNPGNRNIVTRYYEDGTTFNEVRHFTHYNNGENNYYGRSSTKETVDNGDGTTSEKTVYGAMSEDYGGEMWEKWQHIEIEIDPDGNEYEGIVEYGIRPNDAGWVVGIDNFKVTKVSATDIAAADGATEGTTVFNIRAETETKKQGLRFKSTIDLDILDELGDGAKIVEYGTIAANSEKLDGNQLVRQAAKDKAKNGDSCIVVGVAYNRDNGTDVRYALDDETNVLTYTGVLTGISAKNYDIDFKVRGYAIIEDANGVRYTVYDDIVELSVYDAATQIVKENINADDVAAAQAAIDAYEATLSTEA